MQSINAKSLLISWALPIIPVLLVMVWKGALYTALLLVFCMGFLFTFFFFIFALPSKSQNNGLNFLQNWFYIYYYKFKNLINKFLHGNIRKPTDSLEEDITEDKIVNLLNNSIEMNKRDLSLKILQFLKTKLSKNSAGSLKCIQSGLITYIIQIIKESLKNNDKGILQASIDVINTIVSIGDVRLEIINKPDSCLIFIDVLIETITNIIEKEQNQYQSLLQNQGQKNQQVEQINQQEDSEQSSSGSMEYLYKFFMTLGILIADELMLKSRVGDKDIIALIISILANKIHRADPTLAKWSLWLLINIIEDHPSNKRSFVMKLGVAAGIDTLKLHQDSVSINQQGLVLFYHLLKDDSETRMSLPSVRALAMSCDLVPVVYRAQIQFRTHKDIDDVCNALLQSLISDWS